MEVFKGLPTSQRHLVKQNPGHCRRPRFRHSFEQIPACRQSISVPVTENVIIR